VRCFQLKVLGHILDSPAYASTRLGTFIVASAPGRSLVTIRASWLTFGENVFVSTIDPQSRSRTIDVHAVALRSDMTTELSAYAYKLDGATSSLYSYLIRQVLISCGYDN